MKTTEATVRPRSTALPPAVAVMMMLTALGATGLVLMSPQRYWQSLLLVMMLLPAVLLASVRSRNHLPYVFAVWAFAPEVRRVLDWSNGHYEKLSYLSLAPLLASLTLLIPVVITPMALTRHQRRALILFAVALAYASLVGIVRNRVAALYEIADFVIPMLALLYAATQPAEAKLRDHWLRSLGLIAAIVAAYGWYQWLTLPAWDVFWIKESDFGSVGQPLPMRFRVFSTLNSPGPYASFVGVALIPMLLDKRWRGVLGWPGTALVASGVAISLVRSMWLCAFVAVIAYTLLSHGRQRARMAVGLAFAGAALFLLGPLLPGWNVVTVRASSLQNVQEDGSYKSRSSSSALVAARALLNPIGTGLGDTGLGKGKLKDKTGNQGEQDVDTDTGYLKLLTGFGLIGFVPLAGGFLRLMRSQGALAKAFRSDPDAGGDWAKLVMLSRTASVCVLFLLLFGNVLSGVGGVVFWALMAVGVQGRTAVVLARKLKPADDAALLSERPWLGRALPGEAR